MINYMLPTVVELFPDAKFIHIIRDPRAVALSYAVKEHRKMLNAEPTYRRRGLWLPFDDMVIRMAEFWSETMAEIDAEVERLELRGRDAYFECHYEDLCEAPHAVIKDILLFLGHENELANLGETISNMNHKASERLSPELLSRIDSAVANAPERFRDAKLSKSTPGLHPVSKTPR